MKRYILLVLNLVVLPVVTPFRDQARAMPKPVHSLYHHDQLVGMTSEDPHILFLFPLHWSLQKGQHYLEKTSDDMWELGFILRPDFNRQMSVVTEILGSAWPGLIVPLPNQYLDSHIYLGDSAGRLVLKPEKDSLTGGPSGLLYYKIALDQEQLELLRQLGQAGVPLMGTVRYQIETVAGLEEYETGLSVPLSGDMLRLKPVSAEYRGEWIKDLLSGHELRFEGFLDGYYGLGILGVHIQDSVIRSHIEVEKSAFCRTDNLVLCHSLEPDNLCGSLSLKLREPGIDLDLSMKGRIDLSLDMKNLDVCITRLEVRTLDSTLGSLSEVYTEVIRNMMKSEPFRLSLSLQISEELKKRILNQNLFI